jgi:diguanylate cyclase (GGDEF)-like protein
VGDRGSRRLTTALEAPLSRLNDSREELAKAWLVRVIERASLEELEGLPTDRIARELPDLIGDVLDAVGRDSAEPFVLGDEQFERAARLAELRGAPDQPAAEVAHDIAALQSVLVSALGRELGELEPEDFVGAMERIAEAVGAVQAAAVEELVRARSRELESLANTDPLTGLFNLRYLQQHIRHLLGVHKRYAHPFAVLVLDIDGLKRVNDAHGHAAGDRVLMEVAMAVRRTVRAVDTPARMGGDEFAILAPHQTSEPALTLGHRLAAAVGEVEAAGKTPVGVSIGVVSCPEHGAVAEQLLDIADRAMYRAKASGDRVAVGVPDEAALAEAERKS